MPRVSRGLGRGRGRNSDGGDKPDPKDQVHEPEEGDDQPACAKDVFLSADVHVLLRAKDDHTSTLTKISFDQGR